MSSLFFFFSSRRRHTRWNCDWSSDVCSSDLGTWEQFLRINQVNLHFLSYWDVLTETDAKELLKSGHQLPNDLPGHAQEFETAFALAAFPENVRMKMWTDQPDKKPSMATAKQGEEVIKRIVECVSAYLQDMIDGRRVAKIPP